MRPHHHHHSGTCHHPPVPRTPAGGSVTDHVVANHALTLRSVGSQGGFDSIDLSDNALKKLDNFPDMPDLRTLLVSNNLISRVSPELGRHLKRLDTLVLTNNHIAALAELDNIASLKALNIRSTLARLRL